MKEESFVSVVSDSLMEWKQTQKDTITKEKLAYCIELSRSNCSGIQLEMSAL